MMSENSSSFISTEFEAANMQNTHHKLYGKPQDIGTLRATGQKFAFEQDPAEMIPREVDETLPEEIFEPEIEPQSIENEAQGRSRSFSSMSNYSEPNQNLINLSMEVDDEGVIPDHHSPTIYGSNETQPNHQFKEDKAKSIQKIVEYLKDETSKDILINQNDEIMLGTSNNLMGKRLDDPMIQVRGIQENPPDPPPDQPINNQFKSNQDENEEKVHFKLIKEADVCHVQAEIVDVLDIEISQNKVYSNQMSCLPSQVIQFNSSEGTPREGSTSSNSVQILPRVRDFYSQEINHKRGRPIVYQIDQDEIHEDETESEARERITQQRSRKLIKGIKITKREIVNNISVILSKFPSNIYSNKKIQDFKKLIDEATVLQAGKRISQNPQPIKRARYSNDEERQAQRKENNKLNQATFREKERLEKEKFSEIKGKLNDLKLIKFEDETTYENFKKIIKLLEDD